MWPTLTPFPSKHLLMCINRLLQLSKEKRKAWGWRPGHGDPDGTGREGPPPKDLDEVPGWNHGDEGQV